MVIVTGCTFISESAEVRVVSPFNRFRKTLLEKALHVLIFKRISLEKIFFNKRLKNLQDDLVLVFDEIASPTLLKHIAKHNPHARKIFWYWQACDQTFPLSKIPSNYEVWTYSKHDADKYGLKYNSTFLPNDKIYALAGENIPEPKFDFSFIGKDKGRFQDVNIWAKQLRAFGYSVNVYFAKKGRFRLWHKKYEQKRLSYSDYLKFQADSRCVIDYCVSDQAGLSLRTLEAACFGRKSLTNCLEAENYDYIYGANNVLIAGKELNKESIDSFMSEKSSLNLNAIKENYSLTAWARRFLDV